jgi:hypothetical protein
MKRSKCSQSWLYICSTLGFLIVLVGCASPGTIISSTPSPTAQVFPTATPTDTATPTTIPDTPTPTLKVLAKYSSIGSAQTTHFTTSRPWVLAWMCTPTIAGAPAPYSLTIHDLTPDNYIIGTSIMDMVCTTDNYQGEVGVYQTGEQWLNIGTGGIDGPWTLWVEMPTGA